MSNENKLEKLRLLAQQKLVENGEKERLKELLRNRLMEAGFNDEIMSYCKKTIKTNGIEKVDLETLINEITPKAREIVPDEVKIELLSKIKEILTKVWKLSIEIAFDSVLTLVLSSANRFPFLSTVTPAHRHRSTNQGDVYERRHHQHVDLSTVSPDSYPIFRTLVIASEFRSQWRSRSPPAVAIRGHHPGSSSAVTIQSRHTRPPFASSIHKLYNLIISIALFVQQINLFGY